MSKDQSSTPMYQYKYQSFTPRDRHIAQVLEYQAGKTMDEVIYELSGGLERLYNREGNEGPIELVLDDLFRLPDGKYLRLTWDLVEVPKDEAESELQQVADVEEAHTVVGSRPRKPRVHVDQMAYYEELTSGECDLETLAQRFDVSISTAKRNLDGLVYQGKLEVERYRPDRTSIYRIKEDHAQSRI